MSGRLSSRSYPVRLLALSVATAACLLGTEARGECRSVGVTSANFREGPSTQKPIMYTADRYYPVEVLGCSDGWCKTKDFEGDEAWVAERLLSEQNAVVVNVDRLNVRKGPTKGAKVLFRVDWGEALKVTQRRNDWLEIEDIEGERGWVFGKLTWGMHHEEAKPAAEAAPEEKKEPPQPSEKAPPNPPENRKREER